MSNAVTFKVLEDIAKDLSGNEINFPTFLDITFQVRTALKDPNLNVEQLAKLVGAEPLMSAKIIRMANSAALNPYGREIADVKSAITRVGMEAVRSVSFAVAMEQLLASKNMAPFEGLSQRLWEHTVQVAALCRVLSRRLSRLNPDEAMFAGLVHDIGVFYLLSRAANFPDLVADKAELHAMLVQWHDNIGHALLTALGQPEAVLVAVQEHEVHREIREIKTISDALYIANRLANLTQPWHDPAFQAPADPAQMAELLDPETIAQVLAESAEEVSSLKSALG